ncbi:MAG: SurA N-terminal domain-containing protein [Parachlamydiaceae bacterium]
MLDFFRRHQRYFFVVITVVIVISFSFFGTYSSLSDGSFREQIAFKTVDGSTVTRHQLDEMVAFISTDSMDKILFGGAWGPNFLNDGVVVKDFILTNLGVILATQYASDLRPDFTSRVEKEKRFSLYTHPQAPFVGVESAWNYFSPAMASYFHQMRGATDPLDPAALQARAGLFLMEKQFPQQLLRQVLHYQEKQSNWVKPDPNLDRMDLSLFGYHTAEDWFGPRFMRLTAEFIMNAAIIAEQKGYEVSRTDALADLARNAELSFQQNAKSPHLGVATSQEYLSEQLRRLNMDQNGASNVWRQVMLFRRLFQDMGNSVFVDPFTYQTLDAYALESVNGEIFRLPKEFRLNNFSALQKFEAYLDAIAKRSDSDKAKLSMPSTFLTAAQVSLKAPELVQKQYLLEIAQVSKKTLEGSVGVKESWNWEVSDNGWALLKKQFTELGVKKGATREERFTSLDSLDGKTRARVDAFARNAVIDEHPERLNQALADATSTKVVANLHAKGVSSLFSGLKDAMSLMLVLDAAPLSSETGDVKPAAKNAAEKLSRYTADNAVYYRISVIDRSAASEIMTFAEADQEGVLGKLVDKQLEAYYVTIREENAGEFKKEDGSWKVFADAKAAVSEKYFDKLLKAIRTNYAAAATPGTAPQEMIADYAATLRLYPYLKDLKEKLQQDPALVSSMTKKTATQKDETKSLVARAPLADQWKLERAEYVNARSNGDALLDHTNVFNLAIGEWTSVNAPANGDLNFFHVLSKGTVDGDKAVAGSIAQARSLLSIDAQRRLMVLLLNQMKDKKAISLDYLNQTAMADPVEQPVYYNEG